MTDASAPAHSDHAGSDDKNAGLVLHHASMHLVSGRWRTVYVLALLGTIPAFYLSLNLAASPWPRSIYGLCLVVALARLAHLLYRAGSHWRAAAKAHALDTVLVVQMLGCAWLPPSASSEFALTWRMVTAFVILLRLMGLFRGLFTQAGLTRLLAMATMVLVLCGAGFYWLDPNIETLEDGLWLAFITAATVGYGDVVPTTTASRIFSVFVVLLGCGVLSLITASVAAMFVKSQEREVEREILAELHREIKALRIEVEALRRDARLAARHGAGPHSEDARTGQAGDT